MAHRYDNIKRKNDTNKKVQTNRQTYKQINKPSLSLTANMVVLLGHFINVSTIPVKSPRLYDKMTIKKEIQTQTDRQTDRQT